MQRTRCEPAPAFAHAGRIAPREGLGRLCAQICDALQFRARMGQSASTATSSRRIFCWIVVGVLKVADFGLAKIVGVENEDPAADGNTAASPSSTTEAGKVMGTPNYMSPEQIAIHARWIIAPDIYALGAGVLPDCYATGELPGLKPSRRPPPKVQIDVRLDEIVLRALEKNPKLRYQQVSEVKTCVETITSRKARGPEVRGPKPGVENPRFFARTAIAGAAWAATALLSLAIFIHNLCHRVHHLGSRIHVNLVVARFRSLQSLRHRSDWLGWNYWGHGARLDCRVTNPPLGRKNLRAGAGGI